MDVFDAIADPVRRGIVELTLLRPLAAGQIAERFDEISRPAVSRHLRVLREVGIMRVEQMGRERIYRTDVSALDEIATWIDALRPDVAGRFDAMETEVHRTRRERERLEIDPARPDTTGQHSASQRTTGQKTTGQKTTGQHREMTA